MPKYNAGPVKGATLQELTEAVKKELDEVSNASEYAEVVILPILHVAPEKFEAGMLVYADGTDWDPGSGEGVYRRDKANAAWVFVG